LISAQYLPQPISETMKAGSSNHSVKYKFLDILPSKVEVAQCKQIIENNKKSQQQKRAQQRAPYT
jgi:hypothetical protein